MKKNNKLEDFITLNKALFDDASPIEGHLSRFEEKLNRDYQVTKDKQIFHWKYLAYAASFALIIVSMYTLYLQGHKEAMMASLEYKIETMRSDMVVSLMQNPSASKRLKAVNYMEYQNSADDEIINAMIKTLQQDENANVRLATAGGLARFSDKLIVKEALAKALLYEKDPYVQIDLIQILVSIKEKSALPVFKQLLDDKNTPDFIKEQVKTKMIKL